MNEEAASVSPHNKPELADITSVFLTAFNVHDFLAPLDRILEQLNPSIARPAYAFRHNLSGVAEVALLPLTLASGTANKLRLQQLHVAERIRRIPIDEGDLTPEDETAALTAALAALSAEASSSAGLLHIARHAWDFLREAMKSNGVHSAALELIRQSSVLLWGSFEVLSRDTFVQHLNLNPAACTALLEHPTTKRRFEMKAVPIESLSAYSYDLSAHMGDILVARYDLSDLGGIKDAFAVTFGEFSALRKCLQDSRLWVLFQRRNLIVHRRAIIDQRYRESTGEDVAEGSELVVTPEDLREQFSVVRDVGAEIIAAAFLNTKDT